MASRKGGAAGGRARQPTAIERAVRELARRRLSEAELAARLEAAGYASEDVAAALSRVREAGYLDDRALAADLVDRLRAAGTGGPARVRATLARRGLEAPALGGDAAEAAALRVAKLGDRRDARVYRRVYNALLRAGFEPDAIQAALEPHFPGVLTDDPA